MKETIQPLLDEHLQSLQGIKEIGTDDFFYTRLKARMEKTSQSNNWYFPLQPKLLTSTLILLLALNIVIQFGNAGANSLENKEDAEESLYDFAKALDLANSSSF